MNTEQVIDLLNEDLRNEYKHHRFYLQAHFMLVGIDRLTFGGWLKRQADEELCHVAAFAAKIRSLGGVPTVEANLYPTTLTTTSAILTYASGMEREVVSIYHARLRQMEEFSRETGANYDLVLLYEEQIEDSQGDLDEMLRMLGASR